MIKKILILLLCLIGFTGINCLAEAATQKDSVATKKARQEEKIKDCQAKNETIEQLSKQIKEESKRLPTLRSRYMQTKAKGGMQAQHYKARLKHTLKRQKTLRLKKKKLTESYKNKCASVALNT